MAGTPIPSEAQVLEIAAAMSEFRKETDRGCIIVSAAILEVWLERVLAGAMKGGKGSELFDGPNAPFGSFSSKTLVAHQLGLISDRTRSRLDIIRRMRNEAAHSHRPTAFGDQSVISRVRELGSVQYLEGYGPLSPRAQFEAATADLLGLLLGYANIVRPIPWTPASALDLGDIPEAERPAAMSRLSQKGAVAPAADRCWWNVS